MGCNTREENALEAMQEDLDSQRRSLVPLELDAWARHWREGNAYCPACKQDDVSTVDSDSDGSSRTETWECGPCGVRWKVRLEESAVAFMEDHGEVDHQWIEFADLAAAEAKPDR